MIYNSRLCAPFNRHSITSVTRRRKFDSHFLFQYGHAMPTAKPQNLMMMKMRPVHSQLAGCYKFSRLKWCIDHFMTSKSTTIIAKIIYCALHHSLSLGWSDNYCPQSRRRRRSNGDIKEYTNIVIGEINMDCLTGWADQMGLVVVGWRDANEEMRPRYTTLSFDSSGRDR